MAGKQMHSVKPTTLFLTVGVAGGQNQIPTFGFILLFTNHTIDD